MHIQLSELFDTLKYSLSITPTHLTWNQQLHSLHFKYLWLWAINLLHIPHANPYGPGLGSISPEMVNKRAMMARLRTDPLTKNSEYADTAGTMLILEMMVPPLVQPKNTWKCISDILRLIILS